MHLSFLSKYEFLSYLLLVAGFLGVPYIIVCDTGTPQKISVNIGRVGLQIKFLSPTPIEFAGLQINSSLLSHIGFAGLHNVSARERCTPGGRD